MLAVCSVCQLILSHFEIKKNKVCGGVGGGGGGGGGWRGETKVDREHDVLIRPPYLLLGTKVYLNGLIIQNLNYRYIQRVTSELPIAIKHMCRTIKHPAPRSIVTNAFEISAASVSGSTVHYIPISVVDTAVSVTFPAVSVREQF